jgi:hypothetical protein
VQNPFSATVKFRSGLSPDELTIDDIAELIRKGKLRAGDSLTHAGAADWKPAAQFRELQPLFASRVAPALQPRPTPPLVFDRRLFLSAVLGGIVFFLVFAANPLWFAVTHRRWQRTTATVTESGVRSGSVLRYSYVVEGVEYPGIDPNGTAWVGNQMIIEYDPAHPAVSSRIPSISWETYGEALLGIATAAVGLFSYLKPASGVAQWLARHGDFD